MTVLNSWKHIIDVKYNELTFCQRLLNCSISFVYMYIFLNTSKNITIREIPIITIFRQFLSYDFL